MIAIWWISVAKASSGIHIFTFSQRGRKSDVLLVGKYVQVLERRLGRTRQQFVVWSTTCVFVEGELSLHAASVELSVG